MAVLPELDKDHVLGNAHLLHLALTERMGRRGWQFHAAGTSVSAHRLEWPAQLLVLVREAEADAAPMLGLAVELGAMPLRGERFRDIFNADREDLLHAYGNFTLRQQAAEGQWLRPVNGRSVVHGLSEGLSRKARLAVLDRAGEPDNLVERFAQDSQRFVETGSAIAALLQRLYQRTVLNTPPSGTSLPDLVRPSVGVFPLAAGGDSEYPWRR